jgi:hypothetical protein
MKNFSGISGKLLLKKRVVLKITNKDVPGKKSKYMHTVPTLPSTLPTLTNLAG